MNTKIYISPPPSRPSQAPPLTPATLHPLRPLIMLILVLLILILFKPTAASLGAASAIGRWQCPMAHIIPKYMRNQTKPMETDGKSITLHMKSC